MGDNMKHIFVMNPVSGVRNQNEEINEIIERIINEGLAEIGMINFIYFPVIIKADLITKITSDNGLFVKHLNIVAIKLFFVSSINICINLA